MAIDHPLKREREGAEGSLSKTKMGHKMAPVHHRLTFPDRDSRSSISSKSVNADDVFEPMDEELAIVVGQQSLADDSTDPDDDEVVDYAPLRMVKPGRVESEQEKLPDVHHMHPARDVVTYKRMRGKPTGSQSSKSKMVEKPVLVDSGSGSSSSTSRESDKGDDFVPTVSNVNSQKKCASVQDSCGSAWARALEVQEKLPGDDPSFVKRMLQSHAVRGFWLGLPCKFCKEHLPKHDVVIALEDEGGDSYDTKYLGYKQGLSGGWRGFAIRHGIKVDDVVVFQLVRSTRFKVYILRENKSTSTDGALGLLSLDTSKEKKSTEESSDDDVKSKEDPEVTRVSESSDDDVKSKEDPEVTRVSSAVANDDINSLASEEAVDDGIRFSDSDTGFDEVTSFSNFSIVVDGLVIDGEFPDHLRKTYYELCCARKSFLHKHLLKQINLPLAVGVIMETANIAEGIRGCSYSREDLAAWKKTLESSELLGMDVAFLLKRVHDLLGVLLPAQPRDPEVYQEMKRKLGCTLEKMKAIESEMSGVKEALKEIDAEMETSVKKSAQEMRRMATAPW